MLLRKLWVLVGPLLIMLIVYSATLVALAVVCSFLGWLIGGGGRIELDVLWRIQRPVILSGASVFGAVAIVRWVLHLWELRRRLRQTRTSLTDFSS